MIEMVFAPKGLHPKAQGRAVYVEDTWVTLWHRHG